MRKRAKIVKHTREPRQPGGWRSTVVIVALGLASFGIVFDLASDGKIRHFIRSNLMPPQALKRAKNSLRLKLQM